MLSCLSVYREPLCGIRRIRSREGWLTRWDNVLLSESIKRNLELVLKKKKCLLIANHIMFFDVTCWFIRQLRTCQCHLALDCISSLCSSEVSVGFSVWVTHVASFCAHTHRRSWACAHCIVRPQGRLHRCDPRKWIERCSGRTAGWSQRCSTPSPGPNTPKSCCPGLKSVSMPVGMKYIQKCNV